MNWTTMEAYYGKIHKCRGTQAPPIAEIRVWPGRAAMELSSYLPTPDNRPVGIAVPIHVCPFCMAPLTSVGLSLLREKVVMRELPEKLEI